MTAPIEPAGGWRTRYGPQQFRDVLGLAEWQHQRATASGILPGPDAAGGKWLGETVRGLYPLRVAIRRHAGSVPDLGAERAAEHLTVRLGVQVWPHALPELARRGRILVVGDYKGHPLYCGRTLETWDAADDMEDMNTAGERLTVDRVVDRLGVRRSDVDALITRGWLVPVGWGRGPFTARKYAADVPLYRAGDVTALLLDGGIDWAAVRAVGKGRRSLLAKLPPRDPAAEDGESR